MLCTTWTINNTNETFSISYCNIQFSTLSSKKELLTLTSLVIKMWRSDQKYNLCVQELIRLAKAPSGWENSVCLAFGLPQGWRMLSFSLERISYTLCITKPLFQLVLTRVDPTIWHISDCLYLWLLFVYIHF